MARAGLARLWPRLVGILAASVVAAAFGSSILSGTAPAPTGTPRPEPADAKREAAQRDAPPSPPPTQRPWRAQDTRDVVANLPHDLNFDSTIRTLTSGPEADPRAVGRTPILGAPLFVRGLAAEDPNEFFVPIVVDGTTIAVMVVPISGDGTGQLMGMRGWSSGPSFPAHTAGEAIGLAGQSGQPGTRAELVWTYIRGTSDEMSPFWRIERAGHALSCVFEDGTVTSASALGFD